MLEKWIMQYYAFNQKLEFFGVFWLQNWLWLSCLSISEIWRDGERRKKSVILPNPLYKKKCHPEENLSRVVLDIWCQKFCY